MPRLPVDGTKVIEYRLTLGTYERERLDQLVTAIQVKNISTPIVDIMKDVSATATLLIILSELFGFDFEIPEIVDDAGDLVKSWLKQQAQAAERQEGEARGERANSLVGGLRNLAYGLVRPFVVWQARRGDDISDFVDLSGPIYTPPSDPNYSGIDADYVDPGLSN